MTTTSSIVSEADSGRATVAGHDSHHAASNLKSFVTESEPGQSSENITENEEYIYRSDAREVVQVPESHSTDYEYNVVQLPKSCIASDLTDSTLVPGFPPSAYTQSYTQQSDISYSMNRLTCDEHIAEEASFEKDTLIVQEIDKPIFKLILDYNFMIDLVRTSSVPVVMCTATLAGLSPQRKAALLQDFMINAVRFKDSESHLAVQYRENIRKRSSKEGFSCFNFNILGEFPFSNLVWLLGTKRSSISLCFLCCLLQALKLRKIDINLLETKNDAREDGSVGRKHGIWLFYEAAKRLEVLRSQPKKLGLLEPGVTMLNVFNIGPSKAAYNFLPFLGQHCQRSLPLFFVPTTKSTESERGTQESHTSIRHLLNAYVPKEEVSYRRLSQGESETGYDIRKAFTERGLNKPEFQKIDLSDMQQTKRKLEKIVVKNMSKYVTGLPVRWVFLRSLLQALNISLMTRSDISEWATSCGAGIDPSEVEAFLTTFTSFASLLYIPSYTDIVLLDIERFTDCLDKVFDCGRSLDEANSYGFITEAAIDKLAKDEKLDPKLFKSLLKSFCFITSISLSKIECLKYFSLTEVASYFYIPSMRPSEPANGHSPHSLYLRCSPGILGNVQVLLVCEILSHDNCYIVPYKHINTSIIRVKHSEEHVDVKMIDHKDVIELRLENIDPLSTKKYKAVCLLIVKACAIAMKNHKYQYHFELLCVDDAKNHIIYHSKNNYSKCPSCVDAINSDAIQKHWMNAIINYGTAT
ncbi:PREDICTED: uncharacterized protein LOC109584400 [Amphimedon queenslandica]|uniref:Uncharacterized protein n=1 Tax=Amphimedon queenslandica TaxID=400682 RepID=A0A1X7U7B8_AMPQE|nr:PREDICTED: uncharacterized protein LOC109584400 [Amphimedon queenslandica]|eukprot:XP_019855704.1 PREDICTED: uncharacterized protein LOC109584400 [Amphimedon queenslandica]